ncbi:MAG: FmdB family zinc ribbon protein [Mycobacterium sp.]
MPTYSYACTDCGNHFDVVQAFTDDALTTCDRCSGRLRKLFGPVGVVFKGSGFYHNDSREARKAAANGHSRTSTESSTESGAETGSAASSGDKSSSTEKTISGDKPMSSDKRDKSGSSTTSTAAAAASG